jgi:curli biogenesis system outer membrane secretion channel CsgG
MKRTAGLIACGLSLLTACVTTDQSVRKDALAVTKELRTGPQEAPLRTITSFTPALRCMDNLFLMYGVRDLVVISEDLNDNTKKVSAGTRDMLISSVSEMTKRSKAVRLIAYGADSSNLVSFLKEAEKKNMFQLTPQYGIRGSITQLDENVGKKTEGGGIALDGVGIGRAATAATTILGLDLSMMSTEDLSIVAGVNSSNSVAIVKSGSGVEGEAGYKKFGINYQANLSRSEGTAQALRNLVEMSVVELFGKLTKTPYWVCLGANTQSEAVKNEISDWYSGMYSDGEIVSYWQQQMRIRGVYSGEVNGQNDENLISAITAYRQAMGLPKNAVVDLQFFTAYLEANHYEVAPKARQLLAAEQGSAAPSTAQSNEAPIKITVMSLKGGNQFRRGERLALKVTPDRDAYIYCFMQDENRKVARFFPNRFVKDALVNSKTGLRLPNDKEFSINANTKGLQEHIMCFGASKDVYADVVPFIGGGDIDIPAQIQSLDQIKAVFEKSAGPSLGVGIFTLNVQ